MTIFLSGVQVRIVLPLGSDFCNTYRTRDAYKIISKSIIEKENRAGEIIFINDNIP